MLSLRSNYKVNKLMSHYVLLLLGLGGQEIILIALVVLLLFGGRKIPELMRGLGKGVKSFKDGMNELDEIDKKPSVGATK